MRRLSAFIILVITILLGIGLIAKESITNINTGTEFSDSRKIVYRVTDPENEDDEVDLKVLAKEMTRRLEYTGVTNYSITIEGEHQISVVVPMTTTTSYEHYKKLLAFNGNFSLCTTTDECKDSDEIFKNSKSYMKLYDEIPAVIIPITNSYLVETLRELAQEQPAPEQNEDGTSSGFNMQNLILWSNKTEEDQFEIAYKGTDDGEGVSARKMREKILMTFAQDSVYLDEKQTALRAVLNPKRDDNNEFVAKDVQENIRLAKQYVDLLNSGPLDYDVEYLYDQTVEATAGNILSFGENIFITTSQFMVGLLVSYLISLVFMLLFYRGAALIHGATSLLSLVGTFLLFNVFGLEFGVGALIGLVTLMGLSLTGSIIHFDKMKNELYKGRTVKKAAFEASKKSTMPILDISIALILFSFIAYFIGGGIVKGFAIFTIIGAVLNLFAGLFGGKFLMWVLAGENSLNNRKGFFGVYKEKIPDSAKEEKQTYLGHFAGQNLTKKRKTFGLVAGGIALCGIVLGVIFSATGHMFNTNAQNIEYSFIQVQVGDKSDINGYDDIKFAFDLIGIKAADSKVAQGKDDEDEDITYFIIKAKNIIDADKPVTYSYEGNDETTSVSQALTDLIKTKDEEAIVTINFAQSYGRDFVDGMTGLAAFVGALVAIAYLAIRYGLAKAKALVLTILISVVVPLSLFIIVRLDFVPNALLSILAIVSFTLMGGIIYASRERELKMDAKEPLDGRELVVKTSSDVAATFGAVTLMAIMISVSFLGFGPALYNNLFMVAILGFAIAYAFIIIAFGDTSLEAKKLLNYIVKYIRKPHKENTKKAKKKRTKPVKNTSAEPEESIFIGIND